VAGDVAGDVVAGALTPLSACAKAQQQMSYVSDANTIGSHGHTILHLPQTLPQFFPHQRSSFWQGMKQQSGPQATRPIQNATSNHDLRGDVCDEPVT
jgi:hypothetical protein